MCKIRIGLFLIAVMICTLSILPAQAAHTSIFGDAITSSIEEVKRYFDMTKQDKVSTTTESGVPVIYMRGNTFGLLIEDIDRTVHSRPLALGYQFHIF